jgi:creatinine amidohydrolase
VLLTPAAEGKVLWQEMRRHELLDARARGAVVIVPVGSIEQHGPHLPLDVDISVPYHLAVRAAVRCADLPVLVVPPVTFGVAHYKMGEPGTISLRLETFLALLCEVAGSIWQNGFRRIILLNGHCGNIHPVGAAVVKLSEEDVWTIPLTYWQMVPHELAGWSEADAGSIGHAGEWETSLQLKLRPELTDMSRAVRDMWETRFRSAVAPFARYPERRRVTVTGVIGDATAGSSEKGGRLLAVLHDRLEALCRDLHATEPSAYRERGSHCP